MPDFSSRVPSRATRAASRRAFNVVSRSKIVFISDPNLAEVATTVPLPLGEGLRLAERSDAPAERVRVVRLRRGPTLTLSRKSDRLTALRRSSPLPTGEGGRWLTSGPLLPGAAGAACLVVRPDTLALIVSQAVGQQMKDTLRNSFFYLVYPKLGFSGSPSSCDHVWS